MGNPVGWFEIYVQDMARAKAFYQKVFQTELASLSAAEPEMWAFNGDMTSYGTPGALVKMAGCPSGGNSTLVYFSCQDCAVEADRVLKAGGKILKTKTSIGEYGFIVLAYDTEDNLFGLHSMA
ncbi:VOC family protein [Mesoterricola silvestris]|uniref:Glyoxalase n=1 Tax=Mesoterricola silvestris TaxID=2927979 RepID=A0AA48GS18_9BACT|nr:VOC family protein [Mesoterricola silvestris]BDU72962.1 glyoxalase [Mesoterricola silvestris]